MTEDEAYDQFVEHIVKHNPDPVVLPERDAFQSVLEESAQAYADGDLYEIPREGDEERAEAQRLKAARGLAVIQMKLVYLEGEEYMRTYIRTSPGNTGLTYTTLHRLLATMKRPDTWAILLRMSHLSEDAQEVT